MTGEPLVAYKNAHVEFEKISEELRGVGATLQKAAEALTKDPMKLWIRSANSELPQDEIHARDILKVASSDWPSAERVSALLQHYRQAYDKLSECYRALSEADRKIIRPDDALNKR